MELYFIRHGQSVNNLNRDVPGYQEHPDAPLTEAGREQAQYLAEFLGQNQHISNPGVWNAQNCFGFGLTRLYTSLVERAVGTAAPVAQALGIPFCAWPEIHEVGGIYSREDSLNPKGLPGKPRSYFEQNFPTLKLPDELDESGWWNRPYENAEQSQPRADQFLADLLARHGDRQGQPEERVAIVSHGDFFVHLMCSFLNLPYRQAAHNSKFWFHLNNCSISRFDIHPDEIVITYLNRTCHLPANLITD